MPGPGDRDDRGVREARPEPVPLPEDRPGVQEELGAGHEVHLSRAQQELSDAGRRLQIPPGSQDRHDFQGAKEAGLDYAGLRGLWIEAAREAASSLTLKRLLQWILLVRAATLKTPRTTWDFVAAELRVDHHTLWRTFREVTGAPPSDHEGKSSRLREAFMDRLETTLK